MPVAFNFSMKMRAEKNAHSDMPANKWRCETLASCYVLWSVSGRRELSVVSNMTFLRSLNSTYMSA